MKGKDIFRKIKTDRIYHYQAYAERILHDPRWKHKNTGRNRVNLE